MISFGRFILKHKWILIVLIIAITGVFFYKLPDLRIEDDESTWFTADDPILENYRAFKQDFEDGEFIVVAYKTEDPFSRSELSYLSGLAEKF
jgi:predicted RND superfamily exporter protein